VRAPDGAKLTEQHVDVAVIGGGQAALATGYYLRRSGLRFVLLDAAAEPGGGWRQSWPSLRLFSPAQWSSLPGWLMPRDVADAEGYPSRDAVVAYLAEYERRYELPVRRATRVDGVHRERERLRLETSAGVVHARAVVSATGTASNPAMPRLPEQEQFAGQILHSAQYPGPESFAGRRVIVAGGGNSGAQLVAELSLVADVTWATLEPPRFLPDEVDGRYLFEQATARYRAVQEGRTPDPPRSLGDVVAVPAVRAARARGALEARTMFTRFTPAGVAWADGREERIDAVIFATGFRPALGHLAPLGIVDANGRVAIRPEGGTTRALDEPRLWLIGYGDWTGFASATLIGVGRSARAAVGEIVAELSDSGATSVA
jgi:cation diffusion facilitator CzcD-associated flavoprotein CzcO